MIKPTRMIVVIETMREEKGKVIPGHSIHEVDLTEEQTEALKMPINSATYSYVGLKDALGNIVSKQAF